MASFVSISALVFAFSIPTSEIKVVLSFSITLKQFLQLPSMQRYQQNRHKQRHQLDLQKSEILLSIRYNSTNENISLTYRAQKESTHSPSLLPFQSLKVMTVPSDLIIIGDTVSLSKYISHIHRMKSSKSCFLHIFQCFFCPRR